MRTSTLILVSLLSLTHAQTPDGAIVPFSTLPTCAAKCGPLFDVQGACAPPAQASVNDACFCSDTRLTPFLQGNANVQSVCGTASCSSDSDLSAVRSWYTDFCKTNSGNTGGGTATTTAGGPTGTSGNGAAQTSSGSSNGNGSSSSSGGGKPRTWLSTHYKWVIMLIVLFISITSIWIIAFLLRRRYLRKKEREIEMRPPVAIGPHQLQAMTGGYNYGDGVVDSAAGMKSGGRGRGAGGNGKEREKEGTSAEATPADGRREKRGWLTKVRK